MTEPLTIEQTSANSVRFTWMCRNPEPAIYLLRLLASGKGSKQSFIKMIDKLITNEQMSDRGELDE